MHSINENPSKIPNRTWAHPTVLQGCLAQSLSRARERADGLYQTELSPFELASLHMTKVRHWYLSSTCFLGT